MQLIFRSAALALSCLLLLVTAAGAGAATRSFSGSCSFEGPIIPKPGITILPSDHPRFDLHAKGTCAGTIDGAAAPAAPLLVDFVEATTPFDSCALGIDVGIHGKLQLTAPSGEILTTPITINMLRAALIAPFQLSADQGGSSTGVAQFVPDSPADAVTKCAPGSGGITHATLKGSFQTSAPFSMTVVPPVAEPVAPPAVVRLTVAGKALKNVRASLPISFTTNVRGAAKARLSAGSATVGSGAATAARPGVKSMTLRLTTAARRTLARTHALRARLTLSFTPSVGSVRKVSRTVTLRRAR